MDLSLRDYVGVEYQQKNDTKNLSAVIAAADKKYTDINAALANAWSNDKAFDLAELLKTLNKGTTENKQAAARKEFFSLYAVTQSDNGSLADVAQAFVYAQDKQVAASALFEDVILKGYIGQVGNNQYKAINNILEHLGVDFRPEIPHSDHFHITFQPPELKNIVAPQKLETQTVGSGFISYATLPNQSLNDGNVSELVSVAQIVAKTTKYKAVLDSCLRMDRGTGHVLPLTDLGHYLHRTKQVVNESLADAVVTVIKSPSFGKLIKNISKDNAEAYFDYVANDKNWMGRDRIEFEVSYKGKTYKVIQRIEMVRDAELSDNLEEKYYEGPCKAIARRIAYDSSSENDQGNLWNQGSCGTKGQVSHLA